MAELVVAYDALKEARTAALGPGGWLAPHVGALDVEALAADGRHDIHAVQLLLSEGPDGGWEHEGAGACEAAADRRLTTRGTVPMAVSPDDSILDLKRALQEEFGSRWGLVKRPVSRHGLAADWDVVFRGSALGCHLFLQDYGVGHGDIVHVIVRRYTEKQ